MEDRRNNQNNSSLDNKEKKKWFEQRWFRYVLLAIFIGFIGLLSAIFHDSMIKKLLSLVLLGFGVYVGILCIAVSRGENVIFILIGLIIGLGFIYTYGIRFIQELFGNGDSKTGYPDTFPPEDDGD